MRDLRIFGFALGKPAGSKSPHPGSALFNTDARSNRSSRSMVRQAHHGRLDPPLVPSIKLRTGSETRRRMRFVHDVNCAGTTRLKLALLYWICWRSDKGRDRGGIKDVLVIRERGGTFTF